MWKWNEVLLYFNKIIKSHLATEDSYSLCLTGRRRSGKSVLGITMAKLVDPDFNEEKIAFSSEDFARLLREYKNSSVLLDEAGTSLYSRDFMKKINKELTKCLQIFGFRRLFIVLCLPHLGVLDKDIRERGVLDLIFRCKSRFDDEFSLKKYDIQFFEKFVLPKRFSFEAFGLFTDYFQPAILSPWVVFKNGKQYRLGEVGLPNMDELFKFAGINKKFWHEYQRKKTEFYESRDINDNINDRENEIDGRTGRFAEKWRQERDILIKELHFRQNYSINKIAKLLNCSPATVLKVIHTETTN